MEAGSLTEPGAHPLGYRWGRLAKPFTWTLGSRPQELSEEHFTDLAISLALTLPNFVALSGNAFQDGAGGGALGAEGPFKISPGAENDELLW